MSLRKSILVIDDDNVFNHLLVSQITDMGMEAVGALSMTEARARLAEFEPDLILLDMKLPDADCHHVVVELSGQYPIVVLTGHGSIRNAVAIIQAGAADYLTKPVSLDELELAIRRELENAELRRTNAYYRRQLASRRSPLIGKSSAMNGVRSMIEAVAPTEATVLILGESGAGKEIVAQTIHERSGRSGRELVTVDATTLSESLLESELFGHEKGAFTGAERQKKGLVEEAHGGTLFLDEIGEVSAASQAKLLRLFETGTFRRVGGTKILKADVRFVVATHRDLTALVRSGQFRSDLYYRLANFVINIPPLRERREDTLLLASHFLERLARGKTKQMSTDATSALLAYDWPGNARELRNLIERAVILSGMQKEIRAEHFGFIARGSNDNVILSFSGEPSLDQIEQSYLTQALAKYGGNRQKAAHALGISERNVYRLIEKHGIR